jgi:hypothetical protein
MDILSNLTYESCKDFVIQIDEIKAGWMDITISTKDKNFNYSASYLTDPLNDLLDATILLLTNQPFHIRGGWFLKDNAIVVHDLEGDIIVWLLNYSNNILTVLIWENINTDLLEDLCSYNFDIETYKKNEFEDVPDLTKNLIFALKDTPHFFTQILKDTLKNLDAKYPDEEYKGQWGFSYSDTNFKALTKWLLDNEK